MNKLHKALLTIAAAIVLVLVFYFIANTITKFTGYVVAEPLDNEFAACLEEKDVTLYINTEDPEEILKNSKVIEYLKNIKIMNCQRNPESCEELGIITFPTWLVNNQIIAGELSLEDLSKYSACPL